ncbi:MAG: sel1 repeat family protein [Leptolyngbyaceae cyanobacterium SM1_3_5]|nr:sel1 repeat family protein [Leptolyngbyaceae cyanobacterium SM1_3_5]
MTERDANRPVPGVREFETEQYDRALPLLLPLAEQGYAEAQCMVGVIYQLGLGGVLVDPAIALHWYAQSAASGYGVASNNLAGMYLAGVGVPADRQRAQRLYEQARSQGFEHGLAALK